MAMKIEHLSYVYSPGTAFEKKALDDVSMEIPNGQFLAIIGHTGSGKSTLIQHLNGLLEPTSGTIYDEGKDIFSEGYSRKDLRSRVGLVFQYPEHQLFEADVLSDVKFGPKNLGLNAKEIEKRALEALEAVGLDSTYYDKSPFELSGGQKRRVAIAGILAMKPRILVLDEPTAGLDPRGRDEILNLVSDLHKTQRITVVLVSHSMEDVANYAQRLVVMAHGKIVFDAAPREVFTHLQELTEIGLGAPQVTQACHMLREEGWDVSPSITRIDEAVRDILYCLKESRRGQEFPKGT
ncbi:MAG: energy-coupling factor transporter ATPase [Lachnospiraceae bacterium]|nr:energy-coupling factor transporter ATPase [Lachnospiraceae bacterium]